jgi:hypothetical protein
MTTPTFPCSIRPQISALGTSASVDPRHRHLVIALLELGLRHVREGLMQ